MRSVALVLVLLVGACALVASIHATAAHRAHLQSQRIHQASAVAEYTWLAVPWIILMGIAVTAVRG